MEIDKKSVSVTNNTQRFSSPFLPWTFTRKSLFLRDNTHKTYLLSSCLVFTEKCIEINNSQGPDAHHSARPSKEKVGRNSRNSHR